LEFSEVLRHRRMVRAYRDEPVPPDLVDRIIDAGRRAPSAGYTQGVSFVVLEGVEQTAPFWGAIARTPTPEPGSRVDDLQGAPVVILPLSHRDAYLARYSEPDKVALGRATVAGWPVPMWDVDAAFATMAMLLAATDAGLGALFFGIFQGEDRLAAALGIPEGHQPIGAIALGWPADVDRPSGSLQRGRRPRTDTVHYGRWGDVRNR
jgi:nitroreductase